MADPIDRAIEALARKQHGAFSIEQVRQIGGDKRLAKRRVDSGQWLRLDTGVYALPGNPPTMHRQMKAAELAVPGSAVSGRAAAVLHELPGFRLGRIEVSAARTGGDTPLARVRHRLPVPTTWVEGIRATSVAQTLADVATVTAADALGTAVDAALLSRSTTWMDLEQAHWLARRRRSPSARPFADVLLTRDPTAAIPQSVLESRLYPLLDDPRLPPFVRQAPAPWDPTGPEVVDGIFPTMCWIVEADGRAWHARVADFERDRARDHRAQRIGWGTSRFTAAQIDAHGYVVDTLLAIFDRLRRAA
jgi:very-short-patch-repair endonuclease